MVDRLELALLAAALRIGPVLLLDVQVAPTLSNTVTLNEVLGYLGHACSTVLVLRVIAGNRQGWTHLTVLAMANPSHRSSAPCRPSKSEPPPKTATTR
jgi:hypothetical protein